MNKSESIQSLSEAFCKFQGEIKDVYKGKNGYGYKYADLSHVLDVCRPLLSKYDLSIMQFPGMSGEKVTLETMVIHKSGEWISSCIEMPFSVGKGMTLSQAVGSIITYCRRYALTSILGIAQTDNDASLEPEISVELVSDESLSKIYSLITTSEAQDSLNRCLVKIGITRTSELSEEQAKKVIDFLSKKEQENGK